MYTSVRLFKIVIVAINNRRKLLFCSRGLHKSRSFILQCTKYFVYLQYYQHQKNRVLIIVLNAKSLPVQSTIVEWLRAVTFLRTFLVQISKLLVSKIMIAVSVSFIFITQMPSTASSSPYLALTQVSPPLSLSPSLPLAPYPLARPQTE